MRPALLVLALLLVLPTVGHGQAPDPTDDPAARIARFESAWERDSSRVETLLQLAAAYRDGDRDGDAGELLRRSTVRFPRSAALWSDLGLVLIDGDATDEALAAFDQAVALEPRQPAHRLVRGELRLAADDPTGALADFDAGLALVGRRSDSLFVGRAEALIALDRLPEAHTALTEAATLRPDEADYHGRLAELLRSMKRPADARRAAETAHRLDPDDPGYLLMLGLTHTDLGDFARADSLLRRAVQVQPTSPEARFALAENETGRGRWRQAVALYNQALDLGYEDEAETQYRIGQLHLKNDRSPAGIAAAREAFEAAQEANPDLRPAEIARLLKP